MKETENEKVILKTEQNTKISDLLKNQIEESKYPVVGAKFNNEYKNLDYQLKKSGKVELIDINSKEGMKIYRRTLTFIMEKHFGEYFLKHIL